MTTILPMVTLMVNSHGAVADEGGRTGLSLVLARLASFHFLIACAAMIIFGYATNLNPTTAK